MFTALHRDEDGNETLWACSHVRKIAPQPANYPKPQDPAPGVLLDLLPEGSGNTVHFGVPDVRRSNTPCQPVIIVMNANGKTVAKYDL